MRQALPVLLALATQAQSVDAAKELASARERWNRTRPMVYEMTVEPVCFVPGGCRSHRFRVYGVDASHDLESIDPRFARLYAAIDSIDEIFDMIAGAIARKAPRVDVRYDPEQGFPRTIFIDYSSSSVDDERRLSIGEVIPIHPIERDTQTSAEARKATDAPSTLLGATAESVIRYLRQEPDRSELIPMREIPGVLPHGLLRLDYGGLVVTLHLHTRKPASSLFRVDVYDAVSLTRLGISIPATRDTVRELYGNPYIESPTHWVYMPASGMYNGRTLRLTFQGERLARVTWTYFIE